MAEHLVYKGKLAGKVYFGCTRLPLQTRLRAMKEKPVHWLKGHENLRSLQLKPMHLRRVPEENALALEAAFTAEAWQTQPEEVRGGPYCLSRLDAKLKRELRLLAASLEGKSLLHEKVCAVQQVASSLPRRGALNRHLRGECFKCGGKFGNCSCRVPRVGFYVHEEPPKRRSGKSESGSKKRKRWGWPASDPRALEHKWGSDVEANRAEDNRKQNARNPDRDRGR